MPDTEFLSHLRAVLESGVNYPAGDYPHTTPLEYAAWYSLHPDIFRLLLEHGAEPNFHNYEAPLATVARTAASLANPRNPREVLEQGLLDATSGERQAWLESLEPAGAEAMLVDSIKVLLEYGADPWPGAFAYFASFWFLDSEGGHNPEVVRLLLERGGITETFYTGLEAVSGTWISGEALLMIFSVAARADAETIQVMLENGVAADLVVEEGYTWLHILAEYGADLEVFQLLLDSGANFSAVDESGYTPCDLMGEAEWYGAGAGLEEDVRELLCR